MSSRMSATVRLSTARMMVAAAVFLAVCSTVHAKGNDAECAAVPDAEQLEKVVTEAHASSRT
jgi:hypothetical protein